ncbi:hypothetical protein [Methanoculleus sediminis]|uniref:hypothetical protein n=1 Tax=Methanoculleus sediminis TaxID=1550566 RepID=UPI000B24D570|nr:hypothetical protein [Methanoculleus sediminis]
MPEATDLVVGGGRTTGGRCIIPIVRTFTLCVGGAAVVSLAPVALLVVEGASEYLALLPGAPRAINGMLEALRDDIDREKERCMD